MVDGRRKVVKSYKERIALKYMLGGFLRTEKMSMSQPELPITTHQFVSLLRSLFVCLFVSCFILCIVYYKWSRCFLKDCWNSNKVVWVSFILIFNESQVLPSQVISYEKVVVLLDDINNKTDCLYLCQATTMNDVLLSGSYHNHIWSRVCIW